MGEAGVLAALSKKWAESVRSNIQKQVAATSTFITQGHVYCLLSITIICLNRGLWSLLVTLLPITEWLCPAPKHRGLCAP